MDQLVIQGSSGPATHAPALLGAPGTEQGQYLVFTLAAESFAIDILHIKEIIEFGALTEVPMMPEAVRGVINIRGAVVPVIDLAALFGRGRSAVGRRTCTVIVDFDKSGERHEVGVVVDAVNEVIEIAPADIEPPPAFGSALRTDIIAGMGKVGGGFVVILEIEKVLGLLDLGAMVATQATPPLLA